MNSLNQIKIREFHINQFPTDRIFISLNESFHRELFSMINIKNYENLNKSTFKQWKNRRHFIPLWVIIKLQETSPYSIEDFERNIIAYKGPSTSAVIDNPCLPLLEDERLLRAVAHLLGDGFVGGGFGSKLPQGKQHSEFRNFAPELLDSFHRDLSVFGNVPVTKNYQHGSLVIPNSIGYILCHLYRIKFDTFNSRVPEVFFNLPKELVAQFLRAFADDEAHVFDSSIEYYSCNKDLLQDVLSLMNSHFPEIKTSGIKANIKAGRNTKYSFSVYSKSQELYLNHIGFDHNQKTKDLTFNLSRNKNRKYNKNSRDIILDLLANNTLSAKELSRITNITHVQVLAYLKELKEQRKVKIIEKVHWANRWTSKLSQ
ncbi:hypothetical protein HYV81_00280 [Candidatus Woesearchaeota archaeon]|nr:hypothetical protein [Candidatus Woesearchaeota archaeon]